MISKPVRIGLMLLLAMAAAIGLSLVHLDNAHLRRQLAAQQRAHGQAVKMEEDNRRLRELLAQTESDRTEQTNALPTELARLRREVSDLEQRARASHARSVAQRQADLRSLSANRNPELGLTRLENFENRGQATPSAAFQTFVWAALKGEDARLAAMIKIDAAGREKAATVIAALSETERVKYPAIENIAALFFADALTGATAAEIIKTTSTDGTHAVLDVRGLGDKVQKVPLEFGPQGWQIAVAPGLVEKLGGWVRSKTQSREK